MGTNLFTRKVTVIAALKSDPDNVVIPGFANQIKQFLNNLRLCLDPLFLGLSYWVILPLYGRNYKKVTGIANGALGTLIDIVFEYTKGDYDRWHGHKC